METEGGNFLTRKVMGIPAWVFLAGAAAIAYFLFMRNSSSTTPTNSTSGGGGSIHTGKTVVEKGAVNIRVNDGTGNDGKTHQPHPPHPRGHGTRSLTVPKDETLGQFGESRNWSADTLQEVTQLKQPKGTTYAGQKLALNFKLKKGDKVARPYGKGT
jgi:hypothetical protein